MKRLPCMLLSVLLPLAFSPAFAQQSAGKPVLSADPAPTPAPAAIAPAPPAGPVTVDPSYVIGPDDSLQITVWNEPKLSTSLPVRPDGMITIPDIGDIAAAGHTPMQLAAELTVQLKKLVIDPTVTVSVLQVNSKRIYLLGEITHVGPIPITPGMTILQAIATAGGPTPYANSKHIYILRGEKKIFFDYKKAAKTGDLQGIALMPGDTIMVP
jgi:polysaccharide biosynthesis/export protein